MLSVALTMTLTSVAYAQTTSVSERRENIKTCLDGRYPSLCRKGLLTQPERARVAEAEQRENLKTCLDGRYPSLCRKDLLTQVERAQVAEAERHVNLETRPIPHRGSQGSYGSHRGGTSRSHGGYGSGGCGSRGGPGWRRPDGKCASWRD